MSAGLSFLLNDAPAAVTVAPGRLVLDLLRHDLHHTGTKEGCKEGDCGACTVLIGDLENGTVRYRPMTSCLMPAGELAGRHLVTVEGLRMDPPGPVQQAIIDEGGSQCGFCTPGIVVSLLAYLLQFPRTIDRAGLIDAMSGNLCRCTGYASLLRCTDAIAAAAGGATDIDGLVDRGVLPDWFRDIPERLAALKASSAPVPAANGHPDTLPVAGGTDLYVQQGAAIPDRPVRLLNRDPALHGIREQADGLHLGAAVTFEAFARHPEVQRRLPAIGDWIRLVASWPIRTRATLGGNIVNASPIGDMTILLLAMDASLVLGTGTETSTVALGDFYLGYKKLDLRPGETVRDIVLPPAAAMGRVHFEKVSRRTHLDIASVNSAVQVWGDGDRIDRIILSVGGVAPVPYLLRETAACLRGKSLEPAVVREALDLAMGEIAPISDIRGSAAYKRVLTRNLLIAHFDHLFPDTIDVEALHVR